MNEMSKLFGVPVEQIGVSVDAKKDIVVEAKPEPTIENSPAPPGTPVKRISMTRLDELGCSRKHARGDLSHFMEFYGYDPRRSDLGWNA